jgi:hypothetical protein
MPVRLYQNGSWWTHCREIWYRELLSKSAQKKTNLIKIGHKYRACYRNTYDSFMLPGTLKRHKRPSSSKKSGCQGSRWNINAPQCYAVRKIHCPSCYHFTTIIVTSVRSYTCSSHEKDKLLITFRSDCKKSVVTRLTYQHTTSLTSHNCFSY